MIRLFVDITASIEMQAGLSKGVYPEVISRDVYDPSNESHLMVYINRFDWVIINKHDDHVKIGQGSNQHDFQKCADNSKDLGAFDDLLKDIASEHA